VRRLSSSLLLLLVLSGVAACRKPNQPTTIIQKPQGFLIVIGAPEGALLLVDEGEAYPLSARSRLKLPIGAHRVTIECDGFFSMYQLVEIKEKEETSVTVLLQPFLPD
jgi:hypothetical protein